MTVRIMFLHTSIIRIQQSHVKLHFHNICCIYHLEKIAYWWNAVYDANRIVRRLPLQGIDDTMIRLVRRLSLQGIEDSMISNRAYKFRAC
jgi:hypothetical protein